MKNEFGAALDRAGYAPSIMQPIRQGHSCCYLCGKPVGREKMDRHEPWGAANRARSKELGLWVELHHFGCHEGPGSVHADGEKARELRKDAQRAAMLRYGWSREEWISRFGKSELSETECRRLIVIGKAIRDAADGAPVEIDPAGTGSPSQSRPAAVTAPTEGKPREAENGEDRHTGGGKRRVERILDEYFPDRNRQRRSAFVVLDGPDMPF